uniref:Uncharacterized protein n=1 Tax=Cacopsylla melanoneura TaxID=428564 RepID=A0A8D9A0S5_9HEMI
MPVLHPQQEVLPRVTKSIPATCGLLKTTTHLRPVSNPPRPVCCPLPRPVEHFPLSTTSGFIRTRGKATPSCHLRAPRRPTHRPTFSRTGVLHHTRPTLVNSSTVQ